MTDDLVAFLCARLDEEEAAARELLDRTPHRWRYARDPGDWVNYAVVIAGNPELDEIKGTQQEPIAECGEDHDWGRSTAEHIARHDPARVLAECAAKRRIIELHAFDLPDAHECPGWWEPYEGDPPSTRTNYRTDCATLLLLAQPDRDHPHFHPSWAMED